MKNLDNYLISDKLTFGEAIKSLNETAHKIILIVNGQKQLVGTLTDGDIRRSLIKNIESSDSVLKACCENPQSVPVGLSHAQKQKSLKDKKVAFLPELDENNIVKSIIFPNEISEPYENTVVLMAGGLGSRMGKLTENCPKPMLKIGTKPILEHILTDLKNHGFQNIFITINYLGGFIQDYFGNGEKLGLNIKYICEKKRMGTAGSLYYLRDEIHDDFILMNADIYSKINFSALLDHHKEHQSHITICTRKYNTRIPYGVIQTEEGQVKLIKEKPVYTYDVGAGVHVISPGFLGQFTEEEYLDMPDLVEKAISKQEKVLVFPLHESWYDIGQVDEYRKVQEIHKGLK